MATSKKMGAALSKQSLFYEYGAKTEDELVEKMVARQTDPNSIENRVKARTEAIQKGVINVTAATINVTSANMNNVQKQQTERNQQKSQQGSV